MIQKTVQEAIAYRRSVRVYDPDQSIDSEVVKECIRQAILAPTSSNLQLWEFYHVTQKDTKEALAKACLNQNAARTAIQFVVAVARKDKWKSRVKANLTFLKQQFEQQEVRDTKREKMANNYYTKIIPTLYTDFFGILGVLKRGLATIQGISKPMYRQVLQSDLDIVAHKSTALAAQNFMISMAANNYDTCPMEGFDSKRVKTILGLPSSAMITMVISCGIRGKGGVYGPQFRVPFNEVYFEK
ncbi:MAG: nitroreductase family protein [Flavobacteriaceae bacterium]|nr:nitroreductase family protein [Flavobacteriaceae bacterium]